MQQHQVAKIYISYYAFLCVRSVEPSVLNPLLTATIGLRNAFGRPSQPIVDLFLVPR
jgi:hypothetical protein